MQVPFLRSHTYAPYSNDVIKENTKSLSKVEYAWYFYLCLNL